MKIYNITCGLWLTIVDNENKPNFVCIDTTVKKSFSNINDAHNYLRQLEALPHLGKAEKVTVRHEMVPYYKLNEDDENKEFEYYVVTVHKHEKVNGIIEPVCEIYELEECELE